MNQEKTLKSKEKKQDKDKKYKGRTKKRKTEGKCPVFALKYDPWMPAIQTIQAKHWRTMKAQDQHITDVFKQPPLVAYRRQSLQGILY